MSTVVITGASRGLGKALAFAFAKRGYDIAICSRTEEAILAVRDELEKIGANVLAVQADVTIERDVELFISLTEQKFHHIDVLINNAAILGPSPMPLLFDFQKEDFIQVLTSNVINPFLVTKRVLPGMLQRNQGCIVNITSEAGATGYAGWGAYGISKFAVEGLTETWADELAETNIRINMVDPGSMETDMHDLAVPDRDYELPKPEEILDVFLYLATEEAKHISGQRFIAQDWKAGREGVIANDYDKEL